jgi:hypothetical protein
VLGRVEGEARTRSQTERVFLLEPSLRDRAGHHAFVATRFAELIGAQRTTIVAGADWKREASLGGAEVRPMFRVDSFAASRIRRYGRTAARLGGMLQRHSPPLLARLLRRGASPAAVGEGLRARADGSHARSLILPSLSVVLDAIGATRDDHAFVPSGDAEMLRAVIDLLEDRSPAACPRIWFRLMYDDAGRHPTDLSIASVLTALTEIAGAEQRVRLSAETAAFAAAARNATGWTVDVVPHPTPAITPARTRAAADGQFVIHLAGQVRADKGAYRLDPVIRAIAARWRLPDRPLLMAQAALEGAAPVSVQKLPRNLDERAYRALWANADLGLLLHDPLIYARRGSGVVCDAVVAGVPFVYLEGTTLAEWATDGNARAAAADPEAIADAVIAVAERRDAFRAGAERAARRFAERCPALPQPAA